MPRSSLARPFGVRSVATLSPFLNEEPTTRPGRDLLPRVRRSWRHSCASRNAAYASTFFGSPGLLAEAQAPVVHPASGVEDVATKVAVACVLDLAVEDGLHEALVSARDLLLRLAHVVRDPVRCARLDAEALAEVVRPLGDVGLPREPRRSRSPGR